MQYLIYLLMVVLFFVFYVLASNLNPAARAEYRKVALVKYKTKSGKVKFKTMVAKKKLLKEFIYTKNFSHLNVKGIKNIVSLYFYDKEGYMYKFENNYVTKLTERDVKRFIDNDVVTFFDVYNFVSTNKFMSRIIDLLELYKDEREAREKPIS